MYLIAGLGNPGKEYEKTRHNVGFTAAAYLAQCCGIKLSKLKFKAIYGVGDIAGEKCIIMQPQTYMNLSGESVRDAAAFYKIPPENIIIMYDDINLAPGKVRIRPSGSAGGHNGMKSIIYLLNSDNFVRIRFGVGMPEHNLADYVLGNFNEKDGISVTNAVKKTEEMVTEIIRNGVGDAMSKFNNKVL